jgi:general secretion pathway protein A
MSYIQDALRRADAENKRVSAPALRKLPVLTERYESPVKEPSATRAVVAACALLALAGGLLWRAWTNDAPAPAAPRASSADAAAAPAPAAQAQADRPASPPIAAAPPVAAPPSAGESPQSGVTVAAAAPSGAALAAAASPQATASSATAPAPPMTTAGGGSRGASATPASPEDLDRFLGSLIRDEAAAWRQLAALWRIDLAAGADPCAFLASGEVLCHRAAATPVDRVRVLDRPGIVKLQRGGRDVGSAMLTAMGPDAVTLRAGETVVTIPLETFKRHWTGEFATLWRKPPGWDAKDTAATGAEVTSWLAARMAQIERKPAGASPSSAQALKASVQAFQRTHGLTGGGVAGPVTLMLVNRATDVDEPRLDRIAAGIATR